MRGVNGLLGLQIWDADEKEMLWDVSLNYFKAEELRYGELPANFKTYNSAGNTATQNYPSKKQNPKHLPASKNFFVALNCQYDSFMSPSSQTFYFAFKTDKEGNVTQPVPISAITPEKFPNTHE